jgi:hypothetical protein
MSTRSFGAGHEYLAFQPKSGARSVPISRIPRLFKPATRISKNDLMELVRRLQAEGRILGSEEPR